MKHLALFDAEIRLETLLSLATFYYYASDVKKCGKLIQKILCDPSISLYRHIGILATTLQIIVHREDRQENMMLYVFKNLKHFLKGYIKPSKTEKLLVELNEYFLTAINQTTENNQLSQYQNLFLELKQDNFEKQYYRFLDITVWLNNTVQLS